VHAKVHADAMRQLSPLRGRTSSIEVRHWHDAIPFPLLFPLFFSYDSMMLMLMLLLLMMMMMMMTNQSTFITSKHVAVLVSWFSRPSPSRALSASDLDVPHRYRDPQNHKGGQEA